nr:TetR/AcrR family transcriptional regulator [Streptomyces tuirus]
MLREYGVGATSIDRVPAHGGAPRGSVYHHFPRPSRAAGKAAGRLHHRRGRRLGDHVPGRTEPRRAGGGRRRDP